MLAQSRLDNLVPLKEFGKKNGMPPGKAFVFATVCELGGGIGARYVE